MAVDAGQFACPDWALAAGFNATCDDLPAGVVRRDVVYPVWRETVQSGVVRPPASLIALLPDLELWPRADQLFICDLGWASDPQRGMAHLFLRTAHARAWAAYRSRRDGETGRALPFRRYVAVDDGRTHPDHMAFHDVLLPASDPWWATHLPPQGWGCRCTTTSLNRRSMDRHGWTLTSPPQML